MSSIVTTEQSRAMGQRVLQMFSDVINSIADELENLPRPIIRVFSVSGSTVTATLGETVLTTTEESKGAWEFKLPRYGAWTLTSTTPTDETYFEVVEVDDVKKYFVSLGVQVKRYGYRIKEEEADPYERVEYILDAAGMTPAHMDFENEVFEYGSWRDVWFVADNKPLMLKYDGTVDYYLDPNDYTKREDGSDSDVANVDYEGNAMAQFPLCWIYRYEDDTYKYEIVCNFKYDENYKAYAHTNASGNIKDYFYFSLFESSIINSKARSLKGQSIKASETSTTQLTEAQANGSNWCLHTWSQISYLITLVVLLGKSTDSQSVFGTGYYMSNVNATSSPTGSLFDKKQFHGYKEKNQAVKVFHIQNLWGNYHDRILGCTRVGSNIYVKMTPENGGYNITNVEGMILAGSSSPSSSGFTNTMELGQYGFLCSGSTGSDSTFYCAYYGTSALQGYFPLFYGGGKNNPPSYGGIFDYSFDSQYTTRYKGASCGLSYV